MKTNYVRTTTQIPAEDYEKLRKIAFSLRVSIATLFRDAIKNILKKHLTS